MDMINALNLGRDGSPSRPLSGLAALSAKAPYHLKVKIGNWQEAE